MASRKALPTGVDMLPSGAFRGRFTYRGRKYSAVWDTPRQAEAWIVRTRRDVAQGLHHDTAGRDQASPLFAGYAARWLQHRAVKESTRDLYRAILAQHIGPTFDRTRLDRITPAMVRDWHAALLPGRPTRRAHAYSLLRTILNTAVAEDLIAANPCRVRGAGQVRRATRTDLPTVEQVAALVAAMGEGKYRTMTLVAAWCGLRFGELAELRRADVSVDDTGAPVVLRVRRGFYRGRVDSTKSAAGARDVTIPPHIRPDLADYLATRPKAAEALLFPGHRSNEHMAHDQYRNEFYRARAKADLPALRPHDLRHFAGTMTAQTGATLREVMARLGHTTPAAALRYQHAAADRDEATAEALSALAGAKVGNVVPIRQPVDPPTTDRHYGLRDTARHLDSTVAQVKALIAAGQLQAVRRGGATYISETAIADHVRRVHAL